MRLKHIEVFNAIMLMGTISAAARVLHITQPAVTQTLKLAELQLGFALFTRQRNRLVPTAEAQALYPEVQKLVSQLESVRRVAGALRGGSSTTLRVMLVPSLSVRQLPDALRLFRKHHANMPVSIRTLHTREIAQAIALQEADVGIVYGTVPHPRLQEEIVATGNLVCVSRTAGPDADRRTTVALAEVVRSPFIHIDERDPIGAMLADQFARLGLEPKGAITVQTYHTAMMFAEQGFGPAIIDSFTAAASHDRALHVRALSPEIPVTLRAVVPMGVRSPRPVADFITAFRSAAIRQSEKSASDCANDRAA